MKLIRCELLFQFGNIFSAKRSLLMCSGSLYLPVISLESVLAVLWLIFVWFSVFVAVCWFGRQGYNWSCRPLYRHSVFFFPAGNINPSVSVSREFSFCGLRHEA